MVRGHFSSLLDFGSFIESGQQAAQGNNPYQYEGRYLFEVKIKYLGVGIPSPNLNPPISVLLFQAVSKFDPVRLAMVWRIVSLALYGLVVLILINAYPQNTSVTRLLWALSLAGLWQSVEVGQIYMPLLLAAAAAWSRLETGDNRFSGVLMGILIALKPHFVLWPICLLLIGYRKAFGYSILTAISISLVPMAIYGPDIYLQWIDALLKYNGYALAGNSSFEGLFVRLNAQDIGRWLGVLTPIGTMLYVHRRQPNFRSASTIAIVASLLASPISWSGYTMFLLPSFFSQKEWSWPVKAAAAILTFPIFFVIYLFSLNYFNFVVFGWVYGWALVILLWETMTH